MASAPEQHAAPDPDTRPTVDPPTDAPPETGLPAPTAIESLINALLEAGPDVAEHVVRAAQELLLAAQAVVDAADRAVEEQHGLRTAAEAAEAAGATVHAIDRNE
jgi:hypothetical protein